jgi:hypothetical protein
MNAHDVYAAILQAADRQLATTPEARVIFAAGLELQLRSLIQQIAGNAANPIANLIEDAIGSWLGVSFANRTA